MKILLVYERISEGEICFFFLDDVSPEDWERIKLTHNVYGGVPEAPLDARAALLWLDTYLRDKLERNMDDPYDLTGHKFDYLVRTGYVDPQDYANA